MGIPVLNAVSPKIAALTFAGLLGFTFLVLLIQGLIFKPSSVQLHSLVLPVETVAAQPQDDIGEIEGDLLAQENQSRRLEDDTPPSSEDKVSKAEHADTAHDEVIDIPNYEKTPYGDIPAVIGADDKASARPLDAYAVQSPAVAAKTRALFSVILLDYGLSELLAEEALKLLPTYTSVAVSPYAPSPEKVASKAFAKTFEPWGTIPLQATSRHDDSGTLALRDGVALEENQRNLYTMMAKAGHVPGLIADGRGKTSESGDARLLLIEAKERGYGLVLIGKQERAEAVIGRFDPLSATSNIIQTFASDTLTQTQGTLFVTMTPAHLKALPKVIDALEASGLQLVPLSRLQDPLL